MWNNPTRLIRKPKGKNHVGKNSALKNRLS